MEIEIIQPIRFLNFREKFIDYNLDIIVGTKELNWPFNPENEIKYKYLNIIPIFQTKPQLDHLEKNAFVKRLEVKNILLFSPSAFGEALDQLKDEIARFGLLDQNKKIEKLINNLPDFCKYAEISENFKLIDPSRNKKVYIMRDLNRDIENRVNENIFIRCSFIDEEPKLNARYQDEFGAYTISKLKKVVAFNKNNLWVGEDAERWKLYDNNDSVYENATLLSDTKKFWLNENDFNNPAFSGYSELIEIYKYYRHF